MSTRHAFTRRDFMRGVGASVLAATVVRTARAETAPDALFRHGVASGDPLADRVIIWTRVTPPEPGPVRVEWEMATDARFNRVVRHGMLITDADQDYTVKVDVTGLRPGRQLYYRFRANGQHSPRGRTRTLPETGVEQIKLAVFSCSNYPAGYFHAYREVARLDDVFASVHLGDYIYEYGQGGYASEDAEALGRLVDPPGELLILDDYRRRHAQYRSDPDLQALHAAMPMIAVWDDHEISNDTWTDGAENHDAASEGDFAARKAAALQAYHEWLPTRLPDPARPEVIYRSFRFGDLLNLHMLDTRVVGRDKQLSYADYFDASGNFASDAFTADLADPNRQLLGAEQLGWLTGQLAQSTTTWDVLGQQVLMGRMDIPSPLVLGSISFSDYSALVYKAQVAPQTLTPEEAAILAQPAIPYNLDAWDGYFMARETVLGTARALDRNLVVLSGDTHNAWASNLLDYSGNQVGVEFATTSVSSPGLEEYFPSEDPILVAAGLSQIIGPLEYANTHQRGYMLLTASHAECRAEWVYVSTVKSDVYDVIPGPAWTTLPGAGNRSLIPG
ncbi:MAG: alkaline phosphatase D family protein [Pseudomonadota bacterium]